MSVLALLVFGQTMMQRISVDHADPKLIAILLSGGWYPSPEVATYFRSGGGFGGYGGYNPPGSGFGGYTGR